MKKILAVIVCAILALGAMSMFGCGDATFNGNYKEASAATIEEFAQNTEKGEGFDVQTSGFLMELKTTTKSAMEMMGVKMDINAESSANLKISNKDGKIQAAGSSKTNSVSKITGGENAGTTTVNEEAEVYYNEGWAYRKLKDADGETKVKVQISIESAIGSVIGGAEAGEDSSMPNIFDKELFATLYAEMGKTEGVKILIDAEARKVKIDVEGVTQGAVKASGAIYLAYDANYNLIAMKYDIKMDMGEYGSITIYLLVKGYDGAVSLPSDLDTYEEGAVK